jgi:hypothetical protein
MRYVCETANGLTKQICLNGNDFAKHLGYFGFKSSPTLKLLRFFMLVFFLSRKFQNSKPTIPLCKPSRVLHVLVDQIWGPPSLL